MISRILYSFKMAFVGIYAAFRSERNIKIQSCVFVLVVLCGICFKISSLEWAVILLSSAFVFCTELLNTALENICDFIEPQNNQKIKNIKDIAAGAVLIASLLSLVIGLIILIPYFF